MPTIKEFADSLDIGVTWEEDDDCLYAIINDSNEYSRIYHKLAKNQSLDDVEEDDSISLFNSTFNWIGGSSENEFLVHLESDFENDVYEVSVCEN